jgi:hypothetical protein
MPCSAMSHVRCRIVKDSLGALIRSDDELCRVCLPAKEWSVHHTRLNRQYVNPLDFKLIVKTLGEIVIEDLRSRVDCKVRDRYNSSLRG